MTDKKQNIETSPFTESQFRLFELIIEFLKVFLWPFVIIFLFVSLQQPLLEVFESLPYLLTNSSEISVAGISLKVDQKLQTEASPKLRTAASNLSKDALLYLLDIGKYRSGKINSKSEYFTDKEKRSLRELEKRDLAFFHIGIQDADGYDVEYGPTELGIEVYDLIQKTLVEQFIYKG